jgi:hypothetical protein
VETGFSAGAVRRVVTATDGEGYTKLSDDDQRDLQDRMASIQDQAALNAGLNRQQGFIQGAGDGALTAWPPVTSELVLLADYVRELHNELVRVNSRLRKSSRIRMRMAVTAGLVQEAAQGVTGQAAINAMLLVNSQPLRAALGRNPRSPLVVILDDQLYQGVVLSGRRGLQDAPWKRVLVRDKYGNDHIGWITVPGFPRQRRAVFDGEATILTSPGHQESPAGAERSGARPRRRWPAQIIAAWIGAGAVVVAAVIGATVNLWGSHGGGSPVESNTPSTSSTGSVTSPAASDSATSIARPVVRPKPSGKLYTEETYNHLGTDVFSDPAGAAVSSGPAFIPFGTNVLVKCYAPNESTMTSINDFYLVETSPWKGEYAPANTFLNADTTGSLDPKVPKCAAT